MNNALLADLNLEEDKVDNAPILRKREVELASIIAVIESLAESNDWKSLKKLVLDGVVESLEKRLSNEANKAELNSPEIYRLQGQLTWAKKYADIIKLSQAYRIELVNIRKQLKS